MNVMNVVLRSPPSTPGKYASLLTEPVATQLFWQGSVAWAPVALQLSISAPQSYALVGITAMLGAVCRVPLTGEFCVFWMGFGCNFEA